jgi:hypothetical protein
MAPLVNIGARPSIAIATASNLLLRLRPHLLDLLDSVSLVTVRYYHNCHCYYS